MVVIITIVDWKSMMKKHDQKKERDMRYEIDNDSNDRDNNDDTQVHQDDDLTDVTMLSMHS